MFFLLPIIIIGIFMLVVFYFLEWLAARKDDVFDIVSIECVHNPLAAEFHEPKNETEFRALFEKLALKLYGYKISVSQERCPDLLLYDKEIKETVRAEVEYKASDFFKHKHKFDSVDLIVCWINDIKKSHIPILECGKKIRKYCGSC